MDRALIGSFKTKFKSAFRNFKFAILFSSLPFALGLAGALILALSLAGALLLASCVSVEAQQPAKVPRIGIVSGNRNEPGSRIKIFRQALQELDYVEGKNVLFEYRDTEGNRNSVPGIVAELVSLKVDVLFSTQAIVVRAAKQATKTIPIVMAIYSGSSGGRVGR